MRSASRTELDRAAPSAFEVDRFGASDNSWIVALEVFELELERFEEAGVLSTRCYPLVADSPQPDSRVGQATNH